MIKLKGFDFKTNINEFTIGEYELITKIAEKEENNFIQKWVDIFSVLCEDKKIISELTEEDLFAFIEKMNERKLPSNIMKNKIVIGDREWISFEGEEFKLKLKELSIIENFFNDDEPFFARILAVVFKDPLLDNNLDLSVISEREKIFKDLIAGDYLIYITTIVEKITKKLDYLNA